MPPPARLRCPLALEGTGVYCLDPNIVPAGNVEEFGGVCLCTLSRRAEVRRYRRLLGMRPRGRKSVYGKADARAEVSSPAVAVLSCSDVRVNERGRDGETVIHRFGPGISVDRCARPSERKVGLSALGLSCEGAAEVVWYVELALTVRQLSQHLVYGWSDGYESRSKKGGCQRRVYVF